jgi:hypothetical protein
MLSRANIIRQFDRLIKEEELSQEFAFYIFDGGAVIVTGAESVRGFDIDPIQNSINEFIKEWYESIPKLAVNIANRESAKEKEKEAALNGKKRTAYASGW